ncbi:MAG TPA: hypothetical protein VF034_16580 [Gemmatimonadaceae bacterium]
MEALVRGADWMKWTKEMHHHAAGWPPVLSGKLRRRVGRRTCHRTTPARIM